MDVEKLFPIVEAHARQLRDDAGYSGAMNDGGAGIVLAQLKFYKYGRDRVIPPEWSQYAKDYARSVDPDYSEYLRLKEKFK
jgi:uncharacterized protein YihD (DUF1040 family)